MAKAKPKFTRIAQLKSVGDFLDYLSEIKVKLPFKKELTSPEQSAMGQSFKLKSGQTIGNRFCILPMEGWDGTTEGLPTELTRKRWHNFAISGAKLLWGCEAVSCSPRWQGQPQSTFDQ